MKFEEEILKTRKDLNGSWHENLSILCIEYDWTSQDMKKYFECDDQCCFLKNCTVDLQFWKILLIAIKNSKVAPDELALFNVQINHQHMQDLITLLGKISYLPVLKLEYLSFDESTNSTELRQALDKFFSRTCIIEYVSFRGNKFEDSFFSNTLIDSIKSNIYLKALNVTGNSISITKLFNAVKLHPSLTHLSFGNCQLDNTALELFVQLLLGKLPWNPEIDNEKKKLNKIFAESSKDIKLINKSRKKFGLSEIHEVTSASIPSKLNRDGHFFLKNKTMRFLDFSNNPAIDISKLESIKTYILPKNQEPNLGSSPTSASFQSSMEVSENHTMSRPVSPTKSLATGNHEGDAVKVTICLTSSHRACDKAIEIDNLEIII